MFKVDIHTHIIPENLNEITNRFKDSRYLKINPIDNLSANLSRNGLIFRQVKCNCWNYQVRITTDKFRNLEF